MYGKGVWGYRGHAWPSLRHRLGMCSVSLAGGPCGEALRLWGGKRPHMSQAVQVHGVLECLGLRVVGQWHANWRCFSGVWEVPLRSPFRTCLLGGCQYVL